LSFISTLANSALQYEQVMKHTPTACEEDELVNPISIRSHLDPGYALVVLQTESSLDDDSTGERWCTGRTSDTVPAVVGQLCTRWETVVSALSIVTTSYSRRPHNDLPKYPRCEPFG
jgi:hypothetical protein